MGDFSTLRSFLADPRRPAGTLGYHELQGFLFTIACSPELVRPLEWIPLVFGEEDAGYEDVEEAQAILGELTALYNAVNTEARGEPATLPADCLFREETLANLEPDAPVSQWSRGFMRGHRWLEESWEPYIPEELDDDLGAQMLALSFFSSKRLANRFLAETKAANLSALAETIRQAFPDALAEYARLGRSIQHVLATEPVRSEKVGRNEPCPCGSGRKYKKCCGGAPVS